VKSDAVLLGTSRKELVAHLGLAAYHGFVDGEEIALDKLDIPDPRRTAADAETLGFARARSGIIRFRQAILQGYLAACHVVAKMDWRSTAEQLLHQSGDAWTAAAITAGLLATADPLAAEQLGLTVVAAASQQTGAMRFTLATAAVDIATVLPPTHRENLSKQIDALVQNAPRRPFGGAFVSRELELASRLSAMSGIEATRALWKLSRDDEYLVRVSAVQELAALGDLAVGVVETVFDEDLRFAETVFGTGGNLPEDPHIDAARSLRLGVQCWALPSLHGAVSSNEDWTRDLLKRWMRITWDNAYPGTEASLSQGFKFAAMHCRELPREEELESFAEELLSKARFWYSQINLLHALTLWRARPGRVGPTEPALAKDGVRPHHPLVVRAAALCATALSRQVRQYIWADEVTVSARPRYPAGDLRAAQGWQELDPEASKLMADVIVLLNLIEGDSRAIPRRAARLTSALSAFPKCMGHGSERELLKVTGTTATNHSDCTANCGLELCPYPSRSEPTFRGELPEGFCREQARLYSSSSDMRAFWQSMEERVRV
jgi:hypothetical protein